MPTHQQENTPWKRLTQILDRAPRSVKVGLGLLAVGGVLGLTFVGTQKLLQTIWPIEPIPTLLPDGLVQTALGNLDKLYNPDGTQLLASNERDLDSLKAKLAGLDKPLALFIDDLSPYKNKPSSHALDTVAMAPDLHCIIYHDDTGLVDSDGQLDPRDIRGLEMARFLVDNDVPIRVVNISLSTTIGFKTLNSIMKPGLQPGEEITPLNAEDKLDEVFSKFNQAMADLNDTRSPEDLMEEFFDFSSTYNQSIVLEVIDQLSPLLDFIKKLYERPSEPISEENLAELKILAEISIKGVDHTWGTPLAREIVQKFYNEIIDLDLATREAFWHSVFEYAENTEFVQSRLTKQPQAYLHAENCALLLFKYELGLIADLDSLKSNVTEEALQHQLKIVSAMSVHRLVESLSTMDRPVPVVIGSGNSRGVNLLTTSSYAIVVGSLQDGKFLQSHPRHFAIDGHVEAVPGKKNMGSSLAAPQVSNMIGVMIDNNPELSVPVIEQIIEETFPRPE